MPPVATVPEYIEALPEDRKSALTRARKVLLENLPRGFKEVIGYGMPSYVVPHTLYPAGYHCDPKLPLPFISIASQKNFVALYHMGIYADPALLKWFTDAWAKRGIGKLDMGKSCIRFKHPEKIPLDLIGELASKMTPKAWIALYEKQFKGK